MALREFEYSYPSLEAEALRAERDRLRNSLTERTEEVEMLRKSNQELAAQLSLRADAMEDKRRLDFIQEKAYEGHTCPYVYLDFSKEGIMRFISSASHADPQSQPGVRQAIDAAMREDEKNRQAQIEYHRIELAKLLREGEEVVAR